MGDTVTVMTLLFMAKDWLHPFVVLRTTFTWSLLLSVLLVNAVLFVPALFPLISH